jgi:hypothetical protein
MCGSKIICWALIFFFEVIIATCFVNISGFRRFTIVRNLFIECDLDTSLFFDNSFYIQILMNACSKSVMQQPFALTV